MFRKTDGMEKRLRKIVKGEEASIKLLEKQQAELERVTKLF
jgi:ribosomal protein L7Ae-like RNA K-turn-binding protein